MNTYILTTTTGLTVLERAASVQAAWDQVIERLGVMVTGSRLARRAVQ